MREGWGGGRDGTSGTPCGVRGGFGSRGRVRARAVYRAERRNWACNGGERVGERMGERVDYKFVLDSLLASVLEVGSERVSQGTFREYIENISINHSAVSCHVVST